MKSGSGSGAWNDIWRDDQLVDILRYKLKNQLNLVPGIYKDDVNIYNNHPQEFYELYKPEKVWYFFVKKTSDHGAKSRKAKDGYWLGIIPEECAIYSSCGNGYFMSYNFHQGGDERDRSGIPTTWIMRQYRINLPEMSELILCQIYDCKVFDVYANTCRETFKRRREFGIEEEEHDDDDSDDDDDSNNNDGDDDGDHHKRNRSTIIYRPTIVVNISS